MEEITKKQTLENPFDFPIKDVDKDFFYKDLYGDFGILRFFWIFKFLKSLKLGDF